MMELCLNCRNFYLENGKTCFNCGATAGGKARAERNVRFGNAVSFFMVIGFAAALMGLALLIAAGIESQRYPEAATLFTRIGVSMIGGGLLFGFSMFGSAKYFGLDLHPEPQKLEREFFDYENAPESLRYWEARIKVKLEKLNAQLEAVSESKNQDFLNDEERESFNQAERLLTEKKQAATLKLNSFAVIRWLNSIEGEFSRPSLFSDSAKSDVEIGVLQSFVPTGEKLLQTKLDADSRSSVRDALKQLQEVIKDLSRKQSLAVLQNIVDTGEMSDTPFDETFERNRETAKDRLQLTSGSIDAITTDMFTKEKFRLEVLEILK